MLAKLNTKNAVETEVLRKRSLISERTKLANRRWFGNDGKSQQEIKGLTEGIISTNNALLNRSKFRRIR